MLSFKRSKVEEEHKEYSRIRHLNHSSFTVCVYVETTSESPFVFMTFAPYESLFIVTGVRQEVDSRLSLDSIGKWEYKSP